LSTHSKDRQPGTDRRRRKRRPQLDALGASGRPQLDALRALGRLRVIQTLSAGVDWLAGRVPERVTVCNARGIYDTPLAE
jgi:phosphoglycerate dehydrogenase-like enzyme